MKPSDLLLASVLAGGSGGGGSLPSVSPWDAGRVLTVDSTGAWAVEDRIVATTYADLVTLRNNGDLIPGVRYWIRDYVTVINGKYDLSVVGAAGTFYYARSAGHAFDLVVTALSTTALDEHARAVLHDGDTYFERSDLGAWDIKYTIDNDPTKYIWADSTNGKGVIYYMRDEFDNEAYYDFKNIQFLAYALKMKDPNASPDSLCYDASSADTLGRYGSTYAVLQALATYMSTGSYDSPFNYHDFACGSNILGVITVPADSNTYLQMFNADWYYTFDLCFSGDQHYDFSLNKSVDLLYYADSLWCYGNHIAESPDALLSYISGESIPFGLNGSIFEHAAETPEQFTSKSCIGNTLLEGSWLNIFGDSCTCNTVGRFSFSNIFCRICDNNTLGSNCYSNTFGNNCSSNTLGNNCNSNTLGYDCARNTFDDACGYNTLGDDCNSNTFGDFCNHNMFGDLCANNTFGVECISNSIGGGCSDNTLGKMVQYVSLDVYPGETPRFYHICDCVQGTSSSALVITGYSNGWEVWVGYNSNGVLRSWTPADLIP